MQAVAKARFVRSSPVKARLVIDAIRGKDAKEALAILQFTPNFAARLIEKVLKSAIANAENNHHMDGDNLKVAVAMVDGGPNVMKRVRHAPQGRGYRIIKRMSHIMIAVEETEPKPEKKRKHKEVARTAKAPRKPAAKVAEAPKEEPKTRSRKAKAEEVKAEEVVVEQTVMQDVVAVEPEVEQTPAVVEEPAEVAEPEVSAEAQEAPAEAESEEKPKDESDAKGGE